MINNALNLPLAYFRIRSRFIGQPQMLELIDAYNPAKEIVWVMYTRATEVGLFDARAGRMQRSVVEDNLMDIDVDYVAAPRRYGLFVAHC